MQNKAQGQRVYPGKGRLRIDRDAGTGIYVETRKVVVTALVRRQAAAPAAERGAARILEGRRPGQSVFRTDDMPDRTREAMEKLLEDLGG